MKQYYCKRIDDLNENNIKIIKSLNEKINMLSFENEKLRKIYEEERKILEEKFQNKSKLSKEYIIDTQSDHLIRDLEYQVNILNSKNINLGKKVTELEYEKLDLKKNIDALKKNDDALSKENKEIKIAMMIIIALFYIFIFFR